MDSCDVCQGKGKVVTSTCPHCSGHKVLRDVDQIDIAIEKGMKDGEVIVSSRERELLVV